jgi:phosphoribosyl 1,2-cyclic phosphodiesterase
MFLLDPGPGTLARCAASRPKINPAELQAIMLSHRHVDHSTDVNVMMEAMSEGGFKKRGLLFAPEDCLEGGDPVVLRYVRDYIEKIQILEEKSAYQINGLRFRTSGQHRHGAQTYGLIFESSLGKISFLVDTEFLPQLVKWYKGARVLVLNVVRLKPADDDRVIQHLCLPEAKDIIAEVKPEVAILTHFGSTMLRAKPWELAEQMSRELGTKVVAASDGMNFALDEL